jgi:adenine-specific DNA methylase
MNQHVKEVVPFSLKDAPSLIERIFPSMKISAEAQKERKAGSGQILTALGSYWKGRKPLVLVRACILGCLLPATDDSERDLSVFEKLMAIDDGAFLHRVKKKADYPDVLSLPYESRVLKTARPEELDENVFATIWPEVNAHLGTFASSFAELVEQLGIMRFGRRPVVADTFAGGGSIPFEAARTGCDAYASDLNPIACLLTSSALNILAGSDQFRQGLTRSQEEITTALEAKISDIGIEHDCYGNRAKAYLYCLETRCPETGWAVPMLPSRVISRNSGVIVELVPNPHEKTYAFVVKSGVTANELSTAEVGTVVDGRLVHPMSADKQGVALAAIRGDYKDSDGSRRNRLRLWEKQDFVPKPDDIWQERLFAIQWIAKESLHKRRQDVFFAAPTNDDLERELKVESMVETNLADWQRRGLVPDMAIEPGDETTRLSRERGWTHWHHLFSARQLLILALRAEHRGGFFDCLDLANRLNYYSKLCGINARTAGSGREMCIDRVFINQALNTLMTYGVRSSAYDPGSPDLRNFKSASRISFKVAPIPAAQVQDLCDIYITDPPYADAVNYHEITEYFIAWLRKNPPAPLNEWNWDSRRRLAIKGKGEEFRASMVNAYKAMADHMPDNGIQIVMFTHQDGKVWSDMAQIFWGAGLQVMADWYIATETTSELKKGGYVQGTHIIVLRKRAGHESGYADEITQEVKDEVARQIEEMTGLNQSLKGKGRSENLFNDADLQMAGYAAALRVLTKYVKIDGKDMTVEAMRPRAKNERTVIDDIIEYAVQVANEHLVPEGMDEYTWRRLTGTERFYLKMLDIETTGAKKVDNYQNFAKAFRVPDYGALMSSVSANSAALKSAADFGKRQMGDDEFGTSITRTILYALWEMANGLDDDLVVGHVRDLVDNYLDRRTDIVAVANYIGAKRKDVDREESQNAAVLAGLIKNERLG